MLSMDAGFQMLALLPEAIGSLVIVAYVVRATVELVRGRGIDNSRLMVAEGVLLGLSFKVASSLLKTAVLHSWTQIGLFAFVLALRTILKRLFAWEHGKIVANRQMRDPL